jgi:hypothetical protein
MSVRQLSCSDDDYHCGRQESGGDHPEDDARSISGTGEIRAIETGVTRGAVPVCESKRPGSNYEPPAFSPTFHTLKRRNPVGTGDDIFIVSPFALRVK